MCWTDSLLRRNFLSLLQGHLEAWKAFPVLLGDGSLQQIQVGHALRHLAEHVVTAIAVESTSLEDETDSVCRNRVFTPLVVATPQSSSVNVGLFELTGFRNFPFPHEVAGKPPHRVEAFPIRVTSVLVAALGHIAMDHASF